MESKRQRQQERFAELLSRVGMNQIADDVRQLKKSGAGAPEVDGVPRQTWGVMPKAARDFLASGAPDESGFDEPIIRDDSEFEDSDGVPVF